MGYLIGVFLHVVRLLWLWRRGSKEEGARSAKERWEGLAQWVLGYAAVSVTAAQLSSDITLRGEPDLSRLLWFIIVALAVAPIYYLAMRDHRQSRSHS